MIQTEFEVVRARLAAHGQEHLLSHWGSLDPAEREALLEEIAGLDLAYVAQMFQQSLASMSADAGKKLDDRMEPLSRNLSGSVYNVTEGERSDYEKLGLKAVADGRVAILLLAGGEGTRLGSSQPKGMYDVGLPSGKTLFQLQAERIQRLRRLAGSVGCGGGPHKGSSLPALPWYIMTSAATVKPTVAFFESHGHFGLDPRDVVVFQQGTLPCFSLDGKILMKSKVEVSRAPDGNGGLYRALGGLRVLEDMERRGVDVVQLYCVDNILVRPGDPVFTGYCLTKGAECGNKVVAKGFPSETVGITCKVDGQYQVVEYSEISEAAAGLRDPDTGRLAYSAANICIHFFSLEFLKRVVRQHEPDLSLHVAKKKIPYFDPASGATVRASDLKAPNGIKMEKFVFDVFRFVASEDKFVTWECVREDEFAPLKNAPGAADFSPLHCRNALYAYNQKMVTQAGGVLVDDEDRPVPQMVSPAAPKEAASKLDDNNNNNNNDGTKGQDDDEVKGQLVVVTCEVSPLVSYAGEGLDKLVKGKRFLVPAILGPSSRIIDDGSGLV